MTGGGETDADNTAAPSDFLAVGTTAKDVPTVAYAGARQCAQCAAAAEISVIVPCYNAEDSIGQQLEALATQQEAPQFEVIVVDNRSTDGTLEVVEAWRTRMPNLRIVRALERQGVSYARNVGASHANAPYLAFCDADDVVSEWWLKHALLTFACTPIWSGSSMPTLDVRFRAGIQQVRESLDNRPAWRPPVTGGRRGLPILMGGNCGFLGSIYWALGGFDENLPFAGEDNDLAARIELSCLSIGYSRELWSAYRMRARPVNSWRQQERAARAHVLLSLRYGKYYNCKAPSPLLALVRVIMASLAMVLRTFWPGLRADWAALARRWAAVVGNGYGAIAYRVMKRLPSVRLATPPECVDFELSVGEPTG